MIRRGRHKGGMTWVRTGEGSALIERDSVAHRSEEKWPVNRFDWDASLETQCSTEGQKECTGEEYRLGAI
jgi:hypothetical protein